MGLAPVHPRSRDMKMPARGGLKLVMSSHYQGTWGRLRGPDQAFYKCQARKRRKMKGSGVSQSYFPTLSYIYSTKLRFVAISAKTIDANRNCLMISVATTIPLIRVRSAAPRKISHASQSTDFCRRGSRKGTAISLKRAAALVSARAYSSLRSRSAMRPVVACRSARSASAMWMA